MATPLFFGDDSIKVLITSEKTYKGGVLDKIIVVTNECTLPVTVFAGTNGTAGLEKYLADHTLTAPKLVAAVKKMLSQVDNDGNDIVPKYYFVAGNAVMTALQTTLAGATPDNDFYTVVPIFEDDAFETWLATDYLQKYKRVAVLYTVTKTKTFVNKSNRIIVIYDGATEIEYKNAAWAGRVQMYKSFIAWKWKQLTNCNADVLTADEILTMENNGINCYKYVRGIGQTSGSLALSSTSSAAVHIDTIIARDFIVMNVATSLHQMFMNNEIVPMSFEGKSKVNQAIRAALTYAANKGVICKEKDGSVQANVTIPDMTADMIDARNLTGVKFSYMQTVSMEKVEVSGMELSEWINGGGL